MERYLVVVDDRVTNVIIWDGESDYDPGDGAELVQDDDAGPGWLRADGGFIPPPLRRIAVVHRESRLVRQVRDVSSVDDFDLPSPYDLQYVIVECADEDVLEGWAYSNGEFVAPE